jgi:predicted SprT family Zn-dependent metalloprotease
VQLVWSNKLSTTAGRANWKRETIRAAASSGSGAKPITYRHHAQIELSLKVITSEDRLLNVLAHEFCHLTTFMLSGVKTNPHGKEFKSWAGKVSAVFGGRGVEVTTKHGYEIAFKYVWECELCGAAYKRHSKSVDVKRHRCGACKGALVQILPVPKVGKGGEGKGLGEYQLFVKEQMGVVRRENPDSPQKEIMGLVGRKYQEHKARKLEENVVDGTEESTPVTDVVGDVVGDVARKLDFLDLTSP